MTSTSKPVTARGVMMADGVVENQPDVQKPDLQALAGVVPEWSEEQVKELDAWQQGHLIECPPMSWVTPESEGTPGAGARIEEWRDSPAQYAVICSQTCDVAAVGPGSRHPFVQVSPVINADEVAEETWKAIVAGDVTDRYALNPPGLEGRWLVDLRISLPVEKSYLMGRTPQPAFTSEVELLAFGSHLAERAARPALHDWLVDRLAREINNQVKQGAKKTDSGWCAKVSEVCLLITGTRLQPARVRLLILSVDELTPAERDRWVKIVRDLKSEAKKEGIALLQPMVRRLDDCTAAVYRTAVPLNIPALPERLLEKPTLS